MEGFWLKGENLYVKIYIRAINFVLIFFYFQNNFWRGFMEYYILTPFLFILRIFECLSQFYLITSISNEKITIKNLLFSSTILAILFEIAKPIVPQYLTSFTSCLFAISIIIFLLKIHPKKAIISFLSTSVIVAIIDCIVSICILKIYDFSTFSEISQSENLMIFGRIIISIITFLIASIINLFKTKETKNTTQEVKNSLNLITIILTFFLLIPNLVMILYYHDQKPLPLYLIIINIIAIIATFFINIFNTRRGIKLVQAEEELITEKIHSKTQEQLVDSLRTFKHDYGNLLQTIHGYIYTKDMDGLTEYFEQVLRESKIITALDRLNPEMFNNSSLYGLVTAKFEYARKNGVTMNIEMYTKLNNLEIGAYDLTRILGILLDNAIEASIGSKKKIVNFCVTERNNKVVIDISNSFSDTGLKIEEMYKKGISSKGDNRGLGLYKVEDILNKYPKIFHDTKITEDLFLQKLIIDKANLPVS